MVKNDNDETIFELFKKVSKEFNVYDMAKALINTVEGIGYPPTRLRLFTSENAFKNNVDSIISDESASIFINSPDRFETRYKGICYYYAYNNKVEIKSDDKFNSIFLGVNFTTKSFNGLKVLKHDIYNGKEYYVYVYPKAPKCLRVGVIGSWSKAELDKFVTESTTLFIDNK